jgi:energy-converting hydrogenase A subunit R
MINSDWEGPWVTADHAFDIMRQGIENGERLFAAISAYDDYLAYVIKKQDYEPGNTLALIAPFLIAFDLDNDFLIARAKENANFIPGSIKAIELLQRNYPVNIISTSYHQYVHYSTYLAGIPVENTYCTWFPIDDYARDISDTDKVMVRQMANTILSMPEMDIDMNTDPGEMNDAVVIALQKLDNFFWDELPLTGYAKMLKEVRPIGGTRKYEALVMALEKEEKGLEHSATIGDSITDWKMLKCTQDAGGLALSFNGNEYAISNCNVAVMSGNCMVTALLIDVFERNGIEAIEALVSEWGWPAVKELHVHSEVDESIYSAFRQAFTGSDFPHAVWVTRENRDETIRVSKHYRRSVRGTQIGALG